MAVIVLIYKFGLSSGKSQLDVESKEFNPDAFNPEVFNVKEDAVVTERVYMDVAIGDADPQRITIGLFGAMTPKTVNNFVALCTHKVGRTVFIATIM